MYLYLLEDIIDPVLTNIIKNDKHYLEDQLIFQQGMELLRIMHGMA